MGVLVVATFIGIHDAQLKTRNRRNIHYVFMLCILIKINANFKHLQTYRDAITGGKMGSFSVLHVILLIGFLAILVAIVGTISPSLFVKRGSPPPKRMYFVLAAVAVYIVLRSLDSALASKDIEPNASAQSSAQPNVQPNVQSVAPATALAGEYDVNSYCAQVSTQAGGSYQIEKECRREETASRLKLSKLNLPVRIEKYCTKIGSAIGGSYQIKLACAEQELEARAQ